MRPLIIPQMRPIRQIILPIRPLTRLLRQIRPPNKEQLDHG